MFTPDTMTANFPTLPAHMCVASMQQSSHLYHPPHPHYLSLMLPGFIFQEVTECLIPKDKQSESSMLWAPPPWDLITWGSLSYLLPGVQ